MGTGMPRSLQNETLQLFKGDYENFSEMSAAAAFRGADILKRSVFNDTAVKQLVPVLDGTVDHRERGV